jgi:hypothetical protein
LFHIFAKRGFEFLPFQPLFPILDAILFEMPQKNANKKFFPPFGKNFLMVCLLLIAAGIHTGRYKLPFRIEGVR